MNSSTRDSLLAPLPVRERRLDLADIDTAVLEGGDGSPIVLLHGPGEFAAKWARILPQLVGEHRVIAPDLPGHGSSGVGRAELDEDVIMRWVDALIDRTCESRPVLVGHILGGSIGARFAVRHGERLDRLVLVDSLGLARFRPSPGFGLALMHFTLRPNERTYDRFWRRCSFDLDGLREEMGDYWAQFDRYNLELARTPALKSALRTLMSKVGVPPIPPTDLEQISVPTSLIWGRHDQANRLRVAEAAATRYGWPLHVIERAADDPVIDQPEAFLAALRASLGPDRPLVGMVEAR